MNGLAQLARNSGLRVRINCKVATTAADSNKQGDVQAMEFGIPRYDDLVWDVLSSVTGSAAAHSMASMTVKYFNLVGNEENIGNERFKWSWASAFSYNRNVIGLAVAYASAICTHLSVHGTAHPMSAASVRPRSAADCLIRSAVDISHPRQQENPPASSSAVSGPVRSDIINGLGACINSSDDRL